MMLTLLNIQFRSIHVSILRWGGILLLLHGCVVDTSQPHIVGNALDQTIGAYDCEPAMPQKEMAMRQNGLDPEHISVLSWNIQKNKADNWPEDFELYAEDQDIVIIQEARLDENLKDLLAQQKLNWSLNVAFLLGQKPVGVLTASKAPPNFNCGFRTSEPIIRLPKSALVSYYKINGYQHDLMVANLHGINFTLGTDTYESQLKKLQQIAVKHEGPMIVAGDFNNWNDSRKSLVEAMTETLALKSSQKHPSGRSRVFGEVIDHVFYRGLEPLYQTSDPVTSSDHNPIRIQFRLL